MMKWIMDNTPLARSFCRLHTSGFSSSLLVVGNKFGHYCPQLVRSVDETDSLALSSGIWPTVVEIRFCAFIQHRTSGSAHCGVGC